MFKKSVWDPGSQDPAYYAPLLEELTARKRGKKLDMLPVGRLLSRRYDLAGMSHKFNVWDFQPLLSVGLTTHCLTSA